ncbi:MULTISPECIES: ribonuclease HII [Leeuwenhoekiella]|uniref:ribonuclease HII n=3 Tax=Flavobacteriaceae TaxID=49546 RepID=UPI000C684F75|nr:ribonuclease HII [Leeuwenhoekiella sp.]MAO43314.1 ribonuclease HII [Leeuwenhoekiella sp.]|tara:strand:+ start:165 stop:767 length:603 start_codon:yes stop_codon:yes gene_type:complete
MSLKSYSQNILIECGTDEAGRGCLAGPVTAAAVILPQSFKNKILTDSKLLTHKSRELLRPVIEQEALAFGIAHVFPEEIDEINILNASIKAMHLAIEKLKQQPQHILVDGNRFKPYKECSHECIIKGDSKFLSIAAASVLAKTERDRYMTDLHMQFPHYKWKKNKGYPTKEHRQAIKEFGITSHHRKSFKQLPEQLRLDI